MNASSPRALRTVLSWSIALALAGCGTSTPSAGTAPVPATATAGAQPRAPAPPPVVRPQDDFYRAVNADWLANTEIPADRAAWGAFAELRDNALSQLLHVVEEAQQAGARGSADQRKIAALYASFMDEGRLETLGAKPLAGELEAIDAMRSKVDLGATIARFNRLGITAPYLVDFDQDKRDPQRYVPTVYQSGLGLPDRDYYLEDDDARLKDIRDKYRAHVARVLTMLDDPHGDVSAQAVLDLETRLARAQWTRVQNRDPVKTYHKVALARLDALTPGYAWKPWLADARIAGRVPALVVAQPSYLAGFAQAVDEVPLATWRAYFRYHLASAASPYLSKAFADENFAFQGGVLRGTPVNLPRWKRGVSFVESSIGFGLGRLYVAEYFPPDSKARMDAMVKNLLVAYRQSIDDLEWMSPETRRQAQAKLAKFDPKIGYPTKWRDYARLDARPDDLLGNRWRAKRFEYDHDNAKLGRPVDRTEWGMTPQTVNAYYNSLRNEVVFPAAILQAPFFDPKADDATNYGAIGAVIGHEISHGFDDRGSRSDGDGRLRNWWTDADRARFDAKTRVLAAQYDAFEPIPGYHVNGALTLGENIADNSGLSVAYKAYRLSLGGREAPVADGFTGDQRFFRGFATVWRSKMRDPLVIRLIKSDPHAPDAARANLTLRNQSAFDDAFGVRPGDGMYLAPDQRVTIW